MRVRDFHSNREYKLKLRLMLVGEKGRCNCCPIHNGENYRRRDVRWVDGVKVKRKNKENK